MTGNILWSNIWSSLLVSDIMATEVSFVLIRWPWVGSWVRNGYILSERPRHGQRPGIVSPTPCAPKSFGREAGNAVTDGSRLCDESSVQSPKRRVQRACELLSTWRGAGLRGVDAPPLPPGLVLCPSLGRPLPYSQNFKIKQHTQISERPSYHLPLVIASREKTLGQTPVCIKFNWVTPSISE